jgi:hypothetical protein
MNHSQEIPRNPGFADNSRLAGEIDAGVWVKFKMTGMTTSTRAAIR